MKQIKTKTPKRKSRPPKWKNRIVGHGEISPQEIVRHDKNWRVHLPRQRQALVSVLRKVGWVQTIIINKRTGKLVDGHLRVEEALKNKEKLVPVTYVDLSPEEERVILLTLDPISAMAEENAEVLKELEESVEGEMSNVLSLLHDEERTDQIIEDLESQQSDLSLPEKHGDNEQQSSDSQEPEKDATREGHAVYSVPDELPGAKDLKDNLLFESDLILGIPPLLDDMLLECPEPIVVWTAPDSSSDSPYYLVSMGNGNCRGLPWERAILCFYVPDFYFEPAWQKKAPFTKRLINRGYMGLIGPDFSVSPAQPLAERIWQVYRQRFLTRYWQEAGIEVIPTIPLLSVEGDQDFLYAGIPTGAPCLALQVHSPPQYIDEDGSRDIEWNELITRFRWALSAAVDALSPQSLLVYGGPKRDQIIEAVELPKSLHVISVENYASSRGEWLKKERDATV